MKKFDILLPNENFRGRSYGEWASEWLKKMLSANPDYYSKDDPVIFLRTNVDYSPVQGRENGYRENTTTHYGRTDDNGIEIYQGAALFFPVVEANFLTGCKIPKIKTRFCKPKRNYVIMLGRISIAAGKLVHSSR
jgi:hypothetical protein